jgi:phosphate acetyltransferase
MNCGFVNSPSYHGSMTESATLFLARQVERLRKIPRKRIVFPEGNDPRVQSAAARLLKEGLIDPVLIEKDVLNSRYAAIFYGRRRAKGITEAQAAEVSSKPLYQAALMVAAGDADGAVGGAVNTTAETVRAAIQAIGPRPGVGTISGVFFLCVRDRAQGHNGVIAFADSALVVDPCAAEIAEIALATAHSVRTIMEADPRIALLSFSTKGSAKHPQADKMIEALDMIRKRAPELAVDGELQADAALVPYVGQSKCPESPVAGRANTLIFPDLASANIGYKLVERLGGAVAFGPFLQGLAKPMNDLSRGCSADDIYGAAIITALQAE